MIRISKQILKIAKQLLADSDYIYDPQHKKKPAGGYHKTEKGWSKKEQKKEDKPVKTVNKGLSDKQKKRIDSLSEEGKWKLAKSKKSTPEILDYLSNDEDYDVRINVSQNPNTSSETLDKMSNFSAQIIRERVARNPNTSSETLDRLSKDKSISIRYGVSKNPKTSTETLENLSDDKVMAIRKAVALHKNTSLETLKKLSNDENSEVRKEAKSNLTKMKQQSGGIDFSKMTPELRQKIKDWDIEDIKKFINWLHKNGYGKGMMPTEEQEI